MGVLKTILVGTLAVLGGCTVVVGGCTVGATKAGIKAMGNAANVVEQSHFNKLYSESPASAEAKYKEVASECYEDAMQLAFGANLQENVIPARVDFDIYEMRIKRSGNQDNIKYLQDWRDQSDKKIIKSITDKTQRRGMKKYLKKVQKGNLLESMCIANGLAPQEKPRPNYRKASLRH